MKHLLRRATQNPMWALVLLLPVICYFCFNKFAPLAHLTRTLPMAEVDWIFFTGASVWAEVRRGGWAATDWEPAPKLVPRSLGPPCLRLSPHRDPLSPAQGPPRGPRRPPRHRPRGRRIGPTPSHPPRCVGLPTLLGAAGRPGERLVALSSSPQFDPRIRNLVEFRNGGVRLLARSLILTKVVSSPILIISGLNSI